jgi:hypothetical protein
LELLARKPKNCGDQDRKHQRNKTDYEEQGLSLWPGYGAKALLTNSPERVRDF